MNKPSFPISDTDLINAICGTVTDRREALRYVFHDDTLFQKVRNYVSTQGGTVEDGEDVFQESVILFDRNIRQNRFKGESSLHTYFLGIAKWYWITERRKRKNFVELDAQILESLDESLDFSLIESENREILRGVLAQIGEKCKELLLLTGIATHTEIAEIRGYTDAEAAKKEVYRCRKKLRDLIQQQPQLNKILKSITQK
jgi:RNA polymerase sigma factor (sigma-70 family)